MAGDRPRVLIVDDHEVVGAGLKALLTPLFEVLGPIRDGGKVIEAVERLTPDVLLLDISLPTRSGLDLLPDIRKARPRMPVVMLTGSADYVTGRAALVLGALGFLPKDSGLDELELALRTALNGKQYLSPRVPAPPSWSGAGPLPGIVQQLTPRQIDILRKLGKGMSPEEMSAVSGVSMHTINFHLRNLRTLLGVTSDLELAHAGQLFHLRNDRE